MPMEQYANVLAAGTTRFIAEHFIEPKLKLSDISACRNGALIIMLRA